MEKVEKIKDLESVLVSYLKPNKKIVEYKTQRLTAFGENYGSLMLSVEINIEDDQGKEEILHAVAKMLPKSEFMQKIFKTPITFKKELELYRTVVPALKEFQNEYGVPDMIDIFAEFYGGRISLNNNSEELDNNAIILLENLKVSGYRSVYRRLGFNLEGAKCILQDLAYLHAVPLAMKILKPDEFKNKILPHIQCVNLFGGFGDNMVEKMISGILNIARENVDCTPYLINLEKRLRKGIENNRKMPNPELVEPFATLIHCDFWVNNMLTKHVDGKPVKNKFVDFQITEYGSVARDVIFFIFDSVQNDVIENHYEELIDTYLTNFLECLEKFNIDTSPFTMEAFENVVEVTMTERTFMHCITMLHPILAPEGSVGNLDEASEKDFMEEKEICVEHKEKLWCILKQFIKRNWL